MRKWVSALFLSAWALSAYCRTEVFIELQPNATIDRAEYALGEIATIVGADSAEVDAIKKLRVGSCKSADGACRVSKSQIHERLAAAATFHDVVEIWGTNEYVAIQRGVQLVALADIVDDVAIKLIQRMTNQGKVAITLLDSETLVELPKGKVVISPIFADFRHPARNILVVPVNILVNGEFAKATTLRFRVAASHRIVDGAHYDNPSPTPVATNTASYYFEQSRGRKLASMAIAKNQNVHLVISDGQITVETEGIALESAAVGQEISVRRNGVSNRLMGRVIDSKTVLISVRQG